MKKKVAHFVRRFLPPTASFIRNQIVSHIRYTPVVIYKEDVNSSFTERIKSNYEHLFLEGGKTGIELSFSAFLYKKFRKITKKDVLNISRFLKEQNVTILHFHYGTDAGMYLEIIKSSKLPSVVSFYGYDCASFPHRYLGYGTRYLKKVFHHIDYCFAMSEDMKNDLVNFGCPKDKIVVHYYGTDVQHFVYKREYNSKGGITLLIVSSLDEKKGHIYVFKALERLEPSMRSKIHFKIVGEGPLETKLKSYVKQHDLDMAVTFLGPLQYLSKEFLWEFRAADIFIHPSVVASNGDKEGIPGTIVEAMATGLPVISTYHAGIPYVITSGQNGLLIKERDVGALADYICKLAVDVSLRRRIGQNAQQYALKTLALKQKEIELEKIYDFVVENSNR